MKVSSPVIPVVVILVVCVTFDLKQSHLKSEKKKGSNLEGFPCPKLYNYVYIIDRIGLGLRGPARELIDFLSASASDKSKG